MDPGQGMSCWAKHCADPAPDRHTALRRFPKRRTQGVVSPTGRECQFLRGARIPHAVCENTTRGGPRKKSAVQSNVQKMPSLAPGLVKNPHGGHFSQGKANDSSSGRKMSGLVPRLGENLTRAGRQFREKSTTPGAVGNVWRRGWVKISHGYAACTREKSTTLVASRREKIEAPGAGENVWIGAGSW